MASFLYSLLIFESFRGIFQAINVNKFHFAAPEVIKIAELKNGLKVAELFHGPTLAFKDLALGVVGELYNYFLEKSKKKCIVLVGN